MGFSNGLVIIAALFAVAAAKCTEQDFCDSTICELPNCACAVDEPPILLQKRPQIVYLTFDDGFTAQSEELYYRGLFDGTFTNPNGCPIRATHFVSARATDYSLVHLYHSMGHEIASHSITHKTGNEYWSGLDEQGWADEVAGMRKMLKLWGKIDESDVVGVRAPFLQGGGDKQFEMMETHNFTYDCSMPNQEYGYLNMANGLWPYTADYKSEMQCQIEPCPVCSHPGFWIQPMLDLEDARFGENPAGDDIGFPCAMLDSCEIPEPSVQKVYDMLYRNFERAYNGNTRAPFGLYVHAAWFFRDATFYDGYKQFIEEISSYDDVWIVPVAAGIEYRKNPMTNADLIDGFLEAFNCDPGQFPEYDCKARTCCYEDVVTPEFEIFQEYIKTCDSCPLHYPWLGDAEGANGNDHKCGS